MAGEFDGAPLVAGTVRGVRRFRVDELGRLRSPQQGTVWRPGDNEATCRVDQNVGQYRVDADGTVVVNVGGGRWVRYGGASVTTATLTHQKAVHSLASCRCGYYAYSDGHDAAEYGGPGTVAAVVEGWGDVMLGTRGFRASHARVLAVCLPDPEPQVDHDAEAGDFLARRYGRFVFRPLWRRWAYADEYSTASMFTACVGGPVALVLAVCAAYAWVVAAAAERGIPLAAGLTVGAGALAWLVYTSFLSYSAWLEWHYPSVSKHPEVRRRLRGTDPGDLRPSAAVAAAVRANYPDVAVYGSYAAMVAAWPPDPGDRPTPATDPTFWERP